MGSTSGGTASVEATAPDRPVASTGRVRWRRTGVGAALPSAGFAIAATLAAAGLPSAAAGAQAQPSVSVATAPTVATGSPPARVSRAQRPPLRAEGAATPVAPPASPSPLTATTSPPPPTPSTATAPPAVVVTAVLPTAGTMSSCYCTRWGSFHSGVDIASPLGTPIYAAIGGIVVEAGPVSGFGNWVVVRQADGSFGVYGHMRTVLVRRGQTVGAGQRIALVGNEGQSTGPHLHFEVRQGSITGAAENPLNWLTAIGVNVSTWRPFSSS